MKTSSTRQNRMPDDSIAVKLTASEMIQAAVVGSMRQVQNLTKCRRDAHGLSPENGWQVHIEGAAGEMAFAKWANRYWSGNLGDLQADDVGQTQIRTRSRHGYELIVHPDDADERVFVLLTGLAPTFRIRGWIWGWDAKRSEFWKDPAGGRPAFFVPHVALHPMAQTPQRVRIPVNA